MRLIQLTNHKKWIVWVTATVDSHQHVLLWLVLVSHSLNPKYEKNIGFAWPCRMLHRFLSSHHKVF